MEVRGGEATIATFPSVIKWIDIVVDDHLYMFSDLITEDKIMSALDNNDASQSRDGRYGTQRAVFLKYRL